MTDILRFDAEKENANATSSVSAEHTRESASFMSWQQANHSHMVDVIAWVQEGLAILSKPSLAGRGERKNIRPLSEIHRQYVTEPPTAFTLLVQQFGLNGVDQTALALSLSAALDSDVSKICASMSGNPLQTNPSIGMALSLHGLSDQGGESDRSVFSPHSPLRYWLLIEWQSIGASDAIISPDERILNFVRGVNYLDERLSVMLEPTRDHAAQRPLSASQEIQRIGALRFIQQMMQVHTQSHRAIIELYGEDKTSKRNMAHALAASVGMNLHRLHATSLPTHANDLDALSRLWQREAGLSPLLLVIEGTDDPSRQHVVEQFVERIHGVVVLEAGDSPMGIFPHSFPLHVARPSVTEQEQYWRQLLPHADADLPLRLSEQFSFSQSDIQQLVTVSSLHEQGGSHVEQVLWKACQRHSSTALSRLAQRIDCKANWETLVLPPKQTTMLEQLTAQVGLRNRVYQQWGFRERMSRGMGISAMFCGDSGTGKTMAAEAIASALELDLYRIDLSSVISKYIGETEKKMRELFQAAEQCGAILFFDEADALFGKRSDVKSSNDRYANIGIDDLLQRIESYRGLAILATNLKSSIDKAFLRRLRFVVDFPFPGPAERERIWRTVFPPQTPLSDDVDPVRLSRLNLTGGSIHNVALNGAFLAAQHNEPVAMRFLMEAASAELQKLDRPVKAGDLDYG
ncbi:AAA family ATPase [Enterovibrio norvegicus]|uniref:ATP-binding protein n=1 Tax=Enterovibrio norvegicus TaxID=188144 RepID=UPI000C8232F6|nr:ATP-binding protein [Enterovibrio norvegicus]MCC4800621.1 ATP-binding protein [Enterovibrio norvegicus]PMI38593.1 AAA family ATPase [Enterovibrio norvegicus]PMN51860.1 AAA family ATPase [Enterovibrio norvegicus]TKF35754.1 ATP-binding protein [Enterovibrio norvegicus]